jgi:hypothetical protein
VNNPETTDGTPSQTQYLTTEETLEPTPEMAYVRGRVDGVVALEPAHFAGYLEHTVAEESLTRRLEAARHELETAKSEAREAEERRARAVALERTNEPLKAEVGRLQVVAHRLEERKEQLATGPAATGQASVVYGLLFLAAALIFVGGEVSVALMVIADGLEMDTGKALLFALGLAMIPVLMKPAFDQLVARPLREGDVRPFRVVLLSASAIGLLALVMLAIFRNASLSADMAATLAEQNPHLSQEQIYNRVSALLEGRVNNIWGQSGLVLAAVAFAFGGTICLSYGMTAMTAWWHACRVRRDAHTLRLQADEAEQRLAAADATLQRLRVVQPSAEEAQRAVESLRERVNHLEQELTAARRNRLQAAHSYALHFGQAVEKAEHSLYEYLFWGDGLGRFRGSSDGAPDASANTPEMTVPGQSGEPSTGSDPGKQDVAAEILAADMPPHEAIRAYIRKRRLK